MAIAAAAVFQRANTFCFYHKLSPPMYVSGNLTACTVARQAIRSRHLRGERMSKMCDAVWAIRLCHQIHTPTGPGSKSICLDRIQ